MSLVSKAPGSSPTSSGSPSPRPSAVASPSAAPSVLASATPSLAPSGSPVVAPVPSPAPSPDPCAAPSLIDLGRDGRLTVLMLGTDWRPPVPGERLDVILVMSLDPVTKRVVAVSLPRDLVFFPQARANGGGDSGTLRVNALYSIYRDPSLPHPKVDRKAVGRFVRDVETALRIEVDYWALTRFKGFGSMVERLGGVRVDIPETVTDAGYGRTGAYFPEGDDYRLKGLQRCSMAKPCRNPLIYARSRKGTVGDGFNSDFSRARRQQDLVMAAATHAVRQGLTPEQLAVLLSASRSRVWTDLPRSVEAALELLSLADGATMRPNDTAVFGPRKWAYEDDGTPLYTYRLRLDLVRAWVDDRLGTPPGGR